jgi:hypothetical protein
MGAVISRKAADSLFKIEANYEVLKKILDHVLNDVYQNCADELFWSTVFGNKKGLYIEII